LSKSQTIYYRVTLKTLYNLFLEMSKKLEFLDVIMVLLIQSLRRMKMHIYNSQDFASFQGCQELAYGHTATKDHPSLTMHAARLF